MSAALLLSLPLALGQPSAGPLEPVATASSSGVDSGSPDDVPELAGLRERWEEVRQALRVPGLAVVVVRDDEVVLLECFGERDVEREKPVTPDTAFYIASCTKTYVAMRLVALDEAGLVELDAPVVQYLPHMELADQDAARGAHRP